MRIIRLGSEERLEIGKWYVGTRDSFVVFLLLLSSFSSSVCSVCTIVRFLVYKICSVLFEEIFKERCGEI